ncbi:MAG: ABC transporter permease [Spirochaetaceae bacterium]|jgi:multidrug/hemolysin transport system permease protein|nr:ABC transporter permease [Spirochaetaceae bacterium]
MKPLRAMVFRNNQMFLRDKAAVFFSLISVFILIGLYALFLARVQVSAIVERAGDVPGIRFVVDSWILSGLLAVNSVTVSLGVLGNMVRDRQNKVLGDFLVSPLKRMTLLWSYLISALIVTFVMGLLAFGLMEIYILLAGGSLFAPMEYFYTLLLLMLCILSSTSVNFFLVTLVKTPSAFSALSTIIGTLIGFLAGLYMPIGMMPKAIQLVIKAIPLSHGAALLRQQLMNIPLQQVFSQAPPEVLQEFKIFYGVTLTMGDQNISPAISIAYLLLQCFLFIGLSAWRLQRLKD